MWLKKRAVSNAILSCSGFTGWWRPAAFGTFFQNKDNFTGQ